MGILAEDQIVMRQVRTFIDDDYTITTPDGRDVGQVATLGGLGTRFLLGNRSLQATDMDGTLVVRADDPVGIGRDRFTLTTPAGHLADILKKIRFMTRNLAITLADGRELMCRGSVFDFDFSITDAAGGVTYASVSRNLGNVASFLLAKENFLVSFDPAADRDVRAAVIGTLLAVDMIRRKERRAAS